MVLNRDRSPIANVSVTALSRTFQGGDVSFMFAADAHSGKDGSFRFAGLLPGVYVLRAAPPATGLTGDVRYRTTYFPQSEEMRSATTLRVPAGASLTGVQIELQKASLTDISLRVNSTTGISDGQKLTIMRGVDDFSRLAYDEDCCGTQTLADGQLLLRHVPAGTYAVSVSGNVNGREEEGRLTLTVGEFPSTTATITIAPAATINGKVDYEAGQTVRGTKKPLFLLVYLRDARLGAHAGLIEANGDVTFDAVKPGLYRLLASGLAASQYFDAWVNGKKSLDGIVDIPPGPVDLRFRVFNDAGSLEAIASDSESCLGVSLLVFRKGEANAVAIAGASERFGCRFSVTGLRPSDYSIDLVKSLEQSEATDPMLRSKLSDLQDITIKPNHGTQATLNIQTIVHDY